jgi:RNA polymerase sigma factor (sigma-70 family)
MDDMTEIYQRHAQLVYRYLISLTHDGQLSEELTQETFYQALRSLGRFRGECSVSSWLCQIAKHVWYKHTKKHKAQIPINELEHMASSAEHEAIARDTHMELMRCIHELGEPVREVVYLRLMGGLSFREIGDILGRSEVWARVTFFRGREKLLQEVKKDEE